MSRPKWKRSKHLGIVFITLLCVAGAGAWRFFTVRADRPVYLMGSVDRGDIVIQVSATGTLAAVTTVQVGSQVSGNIAELYADFNSEVAKGQLLAKLDPQLFETQVQQAQANVRTAEMTLSNDLANIASARANVEKARVEVVDKQRKLKRQKELYDNNLVARDDLDTAQAALEAAAATQNGTEAQLQSAEAGYKADEARLQQARASLQNAKVNLEHTMIYSPISGTVISRSVDRGQTVAASMSAPTLFTIGEDLTKMQVSTNIYEADVGRIKTGMQAAFTVDAYSGEVFTGEIGQIRLSATTVQNIVTYNAIINVTNPGKRLKPGMTANVKILIERVEDVLKVPNSALRFKPALPKAEAGNAAKKSGEGSIGPANQGRSSLAAGAAGRQNAVRQEQLWIVAEDKSLRPVPVQLGLTDGVSTQLVSGNPRQGDQVVTGLESDPNRKTATSTTTRTPGGGAGMPPPPPP